MTPETRARELAQKLANNNGFSVPLQIDIEAIMQAFAALAGEVRNAAYEHAASECDRHAKFCIDEAHKGGDFKHLMLRKDEALYNAKQIRALKTNQPDENEKP